MTSLSPARMWLAFVLRWFALHRFAWAHWALRGLGFDYDQQINLYWFPHIRNDERLPIPAFVLRFDPPWWLP